MIDRLITLKTGLLIKLSLVAVILVFILLFIQRGEELEALKNKVEISKYETKTKIRKEAYNEVMESNNTLKPNTTYYPDDLF